MQVSVDVRGEREQPVGVMDTMILLRLQRGQKQQQQTSYFHRLKRGQTNGSALARAARTQELTHTQKVLGLFWQAASWLFCFMGLGGAGWGVAGVLGGLFCCSALWYSGSVCEIVRKEAAVRSIHPLRRFPAGSDVRVGEMSWAEDTLLVMGLTWTWPPAPLRMWWMYYLIFLSLLTSVCSMAGGDFLCVLMKQHLD